ncbi:hypothetical protein C8F01DRAFT_274775 [Mycena amicta]|nr:hypothetical protein C8F01DRAFT_274775 [Mycena amicta]
MFILPASAAAYPLTDLASKSSISSWTWLGLRSLFAALFLLAVVRALLAFAVLVRRRPKVAAVDVPAEKEKQPEETSKQQPQAQVVTQDKARWWNGLLAFGLKWETLPPISLAEALPITLHPPPPPAMRGRYVYRGGRGVGFVRRPEPGLAAVGVEASVPVYESQRPASMAKLIMSRHTYRRPAPPSPPPSSSSTTPQRAPSKISAPPLVPSRSPSPEEPSRSRSRSRSRSPSPPPASMA